MACWLIKVGADAWSWDQQVARGKADEPWSGVRNHTAKLNLMKMKRGERASSSPMSAEIVGICEVARKPIPIRPRRRVRPGWCAISSPSRRWQKP